MHTVVETPAFLRSAKLEGMTEQERKRAVDMVAQDPETGDLIVGSGGCRKLRVPGRGKGKSGGYRVVAYYADERAPVFLLAVLSKGSRANFTAAEVGAMAALSRRIIESLGPLAVSKG